MRRLFALLAALAAGCSTSVTPTNPYDPATPPSQQAKATVRGALASPLLPSDEGIPVALRGNGAVVASGVTAAGGTFVFPNLVPGSYAVEATPTGFVPVSVAVMLAPGQDLDVGTLALAPLSGDQASALTGTASLGPGLDASGIVVTAVGRGFSTVTAPDGSWRLTVIAGSYTLSFSHAGYTPASLPPVSVAAGQSLDVGGVTLAINPARLTGVVTAERAAGGDGPLEGASVSLDGSGLGAALTGPDGAFSLGGVPAGSWSLRVAAPGHVTATQAVFDVRGGEVRPLGTLRLALARGAVSGVVALADGGDPLGTVVEAAGTGRVTFAGAGGAFLLDGLPEGPYQLLARREGYASASSAVLTVSGGQVTDAGTLTLAGDPGTVSGHVDGEVAGGPAGPLAGALVSLDGTSVTALTDAAGDFTLTGVPAGSYLLRVEKARYGGATVPVLGLGAGERRALAALSLALSRGGLRGKVALADAPDATGVVVELTGTGRAASTGAAGDFAFDGLLEGTYEVTARRDGYGRAVQGSLQVAAGAVTDAGTLTLTRQGGAVSILEAPYTTATAVTLQLAAAGVSFYRASEAPDLAGAPWTAFAAGGDSRPFTLADADGAHTVYVQFATSAAGDGASAVLSTSVVLDRQAPVLPGLVVGDGTGWTRAADGVVSLALSAQDRPPAGAPGAAVSGLGRMQIVNGASFAGAAWSDYNGSAVFTLAPLADGDHVVSVRFEDRAGNVSAPLSVTVRLDRVAPDSTALAIRGPAASRPGFTSTGLVTLDLSAADANAGAAGEALSVMLSNTPGFVGARYQPFAPTLSWLLLPGDGPKTVHARFMDAAGNESAPISAAITLQTGAPTAPALTVLERDARPANGVTNQRAHDLVLSADGAPVLALVAENPALTGATAVDLAGKVLPYTTPAALGLLLADADGPHTLWVRYYDAAGNASEPAAATVVLDRVAPLAVPPALTPAPWAAAPAASLTAPAAGQDELRLEGAGLAASPSAWLPAPAGAVVAVALAAGEGPRPFTVTYRDLADNQVTVAAPAVAVDATPPAAPASLTLRGALADGTASAALTTTAAVTLDLSAVTDAGSGVAEMLLSESATFAGATWAPFSAAPALTLSPGDGPKTVHARFRDAVGNAGAPVSGTITLDTTGPTAPSLALLEGDGRENGFTAQAGLRVTLDAAGSPVRALVATNPALTGAVVVDLAGQVLPHTTAGAAVTLAAPDGAKTVYARFADAAGNLSELASATVTYDTTPPAALPPALSPSPFAGTTAITLTPPAAGQDELSVGGAGAVARAFTAAPAGVPVAASLTAGDGAKQVVVTYRDLAGNVTALPAVTVTLDGTAPVLPASFAIRGALADGTASAAVTTTQAVTLDLSGVSDAGAGVAEMLVSESPVFAGAAWQPYAASLAFALSPGDGPKTVSARFRDALGNTSGAVSGTITLDTTGPTAPALALVETDGLQNGHTNLAGLRVTLNAAGAPVRALVADNPALTGATAVSLVGQALPHTTAGAAVTLAGPDGAKTVYARFADAAGNLSELASATVTYDTTPPAALPPVLSPSPFAGTTAVTLTPPAAGQDELSVGGAGAVARAFTAAPAGVPVAATLTAGDGAKQVVVTYRDLAGNVTALPPVTVTLDGAGPAVPASFAVRGALADGTASAAVTTTQAVTLDLSGVSDAGAGVAEMMLSESGTFAGAAWVPYAASAAFVLSAGDGPKTVNARFRDALGNQSGATSGAITLDATGPTAPSLVLVETDGVQNGATNQPGLRVTLDAGGAPVRALVATNPALTGAATVSLVGQTLPHTTAAAVITLAAPDGAKTVYARFADAAGNLSELAAATVTYDTTPPLALPPAIGPGAYATGTAITITPPLAGQDELSVGGAGAVAKAFTAAPAGVAVPATLTAGDGAKQVVVTYRDLAGNVTTLPAATVTLDATPPTASDFTVMGLLADGVASSALTATASVTLRLGGQSDATSGVAEMQVSNDSGFAGAAWQPYTGADLAWVLTPGDGAKTVYARFRDRAGNASGQVRGLIALREAAPTGGVVVVEGGAAFTNRHRAAGEDVGLSIQAGGADEMLVTVDGVPGGWEPYATSKRVFLDAPPDGTKVVSVLFRTAAHVEGAGASAAIVLDTTRPVLDGLSLLGTLADSQTSTLFAAGPVLVANAAWSGADAGVSQIAFVEGAGCAFGGAPAWQPAAAASTVVLSAGDGGRALCAKLRDEAGNESEPVVAGITLDTAAPPNPTFTDLAAQATNQPTLTGTVAALAADPGGTALEYQCVGGQFGSAWTACTLGPGPSQAYTLAPNQENVLGIRTRDAAHNVSTGTLVTVTHDDVPPAPPRLVSVTSAVDAVTLRWTPSVDADAVNTLVYYGNSAADLSGLGAAQGASPVSVGSAGATQYVLSGLATGVPYYLSVAAVDRAGNVSGRSAALAAVPNVANPRLLASIGGKPRGVAVAASGATTYAYLVENLAVLQLDVSVTGAEPALRGRVALDNFAPFDQAAAAVACTLGGQAGHCVVAAGSTLEGDFRSSQAGHRTSTPVVWFPAAGGAGRVAALLPSASMAVAAGTLGGAPVVVSADADRLRVYSLEDPAAPRLRAAARWSASAALAPSVPGVTSLDLTGTRLLAVAGGKAYGFELGQVMTTGAVTVSEFLDWSGVATGGALVRNRFDAAICLDEPDCYLLDGPWEYLESLNPWTGIGSLVAVALLDGGPPVGAVAGAGSAWFSHGGGGTGLAWHVRLAANGTIAAYEWVNNAGLAGLRSGTVFLKGGVEHAYLVRTAPSTSAETLEIAAGAAAPTFGTPYRELPSDRFVVRGGHVYLADGARLRVLSVDNPRQPSLVASPTGTAGVTYQEISAGPGLVAAAWSAPASTYGVDYFLPRGAATAFIGSTAGQATTATIVGNLVITTGVSPVETAVYTWTTGGVFTKRATIPTWLPAMTARREVRLGSQVVVIYGVTNDIPSKFVTYAVNPATYAVSTLNAGTTIPGTFAAIGDGSLSVVERWAIYSEERSSWRIDVLDPATPVPTAANGTAVAGRIALQGGYLAGLASTGGASGPVLATMSGGEVHAGLPFTGCATPGSFEAVGALQYASCHRNGLIIASLANPGATSALKQFGGIFHGGASDGLSSWGTDFTGTSFRVDETTNAEGTPVAPVAGTALPQHGWLVHANGWVFAATPGNFSSYFVQQNGALLASGSTTFTSGGGACTIGNGLATDGRTAWVCHAGGVMPISLANPSSPAAGVNIATPTAPASVTYDGYLWVGGYDAIYQYDVSGATPTLVRTWPASYEVVGVAPSAGGVYWTNAFNVLGRSTPLTAVQVHASQLRLSNPVVAGDLLYVLENRTLVAWDLAPWLASGGAPLRLTPGSVDATAQSAGHLWIEGPFAFGVTSQSFYDGSYKAFDLR